mmetsp:Transcript_13815/g.12248  ORF Transcript_13815/g.12248 Transcript_13815/m.12248 type:complete len:97 (+) Transcript_13815:33-323(+)
MKFSAIFILTLLVLTFSTQVYAKASFNSAETQVESVGFDFPLCLTHFVQAAQLGWQIYQALINEQMGQLITLILGARTIVVNVIHHCGPGNTTLTF